MRIYGIYGKQLHGHSYDVGDCQAYLPKGCRIRRKKEKRRVHKKKMRAILRRDMQSSINQ